MPSEIDPDPKRVAAEAQGTQGGTSVADRNFLWFWGGQTLSQFAMRVGAVAMPVIAVADLGATNEQVGYLNAASTVSFLLIGLPAGAWVDRWLKRRTMMAADVVRVCAILVIPLLWYAEQLQIWHMYVTALVVGLATVFFDVAYQSYVPILMRDEDVSRANARLETTAQLATTGGPALGGLLMKVVSAPLLLLSDAVAYAMSFISLLLTRDQEHEQQRLPAAPDGPGESSILKDISEGLRFVRDQPVVRRLVVAMSVSNFFATMLFTLVPLLVLREIGLEPWVLGLIMTVGSIGGALGAAVAPVLQRSFSNGTVIAGALVLAATFAAVNPIAGMINSERHALATILLMVAEFGMVASALVFNVTQISLRQRLCPKRLLGRMNASIRFIVWGAMPFASLIAGWLASSVGVVPTMWVGGIASLLTVLPVVGIGKFIPSEMKSS